ncbi:hypothetical protein L1049_006440 [Liquidambar formosana]|uniref:EF-hand domain-containing protein n=1 Tax=Liquidambar formosana TaxID=63359 RepID=A0AAP0RH70_LIQFO
MERTPPTTISSRLQSYYEILYWDIRVQKFLVTFHLFFQPLLNLVSTKCKLWASDKNLNTGPLNKHYSCLRNKGCDGKLSKGEIGMVMDRLGIVYDPDGNEIQERFIEDGFSVVFEEEEPNLEELKEAFDVLDKNRDGFIDAKELQTVLGCLGLQEGSQLQECTRMIKVFDENGDGLIDFNEFVKLMEKCSY